jgi:hypothetical protein
VQRGSAEVTVSFAPFFDKTEEFVAKEGDMFYLPLGTKLTFEVGRHGWVYFAVTVPSHLKVYL